MTDITIANGETEKIINSQDAAKVLSDEHDAEGFIIYTDGDIRLAHEDSKDVAHHALPLQHGTHVTNLDPKGAEMYAYADGAEATVSVQLQKFTLHEVA